MTNSNISNDQFAKANLFLGHGAYCVDNLKVNSNVTFAFRFIQAVNLIKEFHQQVTWDEYYRQMASYALQHFLKFSIDEFGDDSEEYQYIYKTINFVCEDKEKTNSFFDYEAMDDAKTYLMSEHMMLVLNGIQVETLEKALEFFRNYTKTIVSDKEISFLQPM